MRSLLLALILAVNASIAAAQSNQPNTPMRVQDLPVAVGLPNPFTFLNGTPFRRTDQWTRRRLELIGLFQEYVYGTLPPGPHTMNNRVVGTRASEGRDIVIRDYAMALGFDDRSLTLSVRVALPAGATRKLPVVIQGMTPGGGGETGSEELQHLAAFTGRGYAVAELDFGQVAVDDKDHARTGGVYALFGDTLRCGTLMAWAWGMHRVVDLLCTLPEIESNCIVVTGHSRFGKAALLAGAFDERIALTVPSHSGCAGSAPFRFVYGKSEALHHIVGFAPHWFRPEFQEFVGHVERLPLDQHLLLSCVAPRALLCLEGTMDEWTNPEGVQLTYRAARKVYEFLGAGDRCSIRFRPVGHVPGVDDLLDYADHLFRSKKLPLEFGTLPYTVREGDIQWSPPRAPAVELGPWPSGSSPEEIGRRVIDRFLATPLAYAGRAEPADHITYAEVCTWYGALQLANLTGDTARQTALVRRFAPLLLEKKNLIPVPDHVDMTVFAAVPLEISMQMRDRKFLEMGQSMADTQWGEPFGQYANPEAWEAFRKGLTWQRRLWIDDMFMITAAQAQVYRATGDRTYIDRAAREMVLYLRELQRPNGLFYHAPDVPFFWGRGNGWMAAGMSELLRSLPPDNPDRPRILEGYRTMMAALLKFQGSDGMWRQLIDEPDSWPESSCSGMFTFAFITGVRNGWLDARTYGPAARKGWLALITYLDGNANMREVCEGTPKKNERQFYLDRKRNIGDLHGQAPVLWCAAALLR